MAPVTLAGYWPHCDAGNRLDSGPACPRYAPSSANSVVTHCLEFSTPTTSGCRTGVSDLEPVGLDWHRLVVLTIGRRLHRLGARPREVREGGRGSTDRRARTAPGAEWSSQNQPEREASRAHRTISSVLSPERGEDSASAHGGRVSFLSPSEPAGGRGPTWTRSVFETHPHTIRFSQIVTQSRNMPEFPF